MVKQTDADHAEYITPLNMNGLRGRMLRLPAAKKAFATRELMVVYGHHALLERWWGLIQNFNAFGNVTMPDLPGFGGMDSFYKIGRKPTIDNLADYLASFIKWRYKRRRITIVGISFGFVVATRMLQRYPEIANKVDLIVSCVGFAHADDFVFTKSRMMWYRLGSRAVSIPPMPFIFSKLFLNPFVLRKAYARTHNARHKFEAAAALSPEIFKAVMDMEIKLWHVNDLRTHMATTAEFLRVDNCQKRVALPVWHVGAANDYYFNNDVVEQHFRVIFSDFRSFPLDSKMHAPSVVATKKESEDFIPKSLRSALAQFME